MKKRILNALSLLLLSNSLASSIHANDNRGAQPSEVVTDRNNISVNSGKCDNLINNSKSCKFEQTWIKVVNDIITSSNNKNKLDIKDSSKNTYKNTPCYTYSLENSLIPALGGGGTIYYDGGYFSFNEFKAEVFRSILKQFLSNRAKYLCSLPSNSSNERKELREIIDVLADNDFDNIISRCVNIDDLEFTLI